MRKGEQPPWIVPDELWARIEPLAVSLTGENRNDVTQLIPLIEAIPPVRGRRGRPRRRPEAIYAGRGYDHGKYHEVFLGLACAIICWRRLTSLSL